MSLKQIADRVGVSVSTVSRVLNSSSPSCASKELQDKIWAAARETGYQPNEAARALRRTNAADAKVPRIAIVLARITSLEDDPFFLELFRSLESELLKQKAVVHQMVYAEESLSEKLSHPDGIIIVGRCSQKLLDRITAGNKNVVGIWRNPMNFNVDEVICDGKKAAELAMQHLISLGHRQIAYIGDCSFESRYVGYCDTLIKNNIPMDYRLVKETNQSREEAESAFLELFDEKMRGKTDFSAVFCANDNTAVRVLELLREKRKGPHRDPISVISIDDIEEAQNTKPFLTTVHIPREAMAHMAVLILLDRIAKGHELPVRSEFPCHIVQRASCCPARPSP